MTESREFREKMQSQRKTEVVKLKGNRKETGQG